MMDIHILLSVLFSIGWCVVPSILLALQLNLAELSLLIWSGIS